MSVVESPFVQSQTWVEDDISNVLVKFVTTCTCLISSDPLKGTLFLISRATVSVTEKRLFIVHVNAILTKRVWLRCSFSELWSLVWRRLPIAMDAGGKSCGNYLRIARSILKHINETTLVSGDAGQKLVADMLETFFNAARKNGVSKCVWFELWCIERY